MTYFGERRLTKVLTECNMDWLNEADIPDGNILNCEENFQGEDVITFKCPLCDGTHKSRRFGA